MHSSFQNSVHTEKQIEYTLERILSDILNDVFFFMNIEMSMGLYKAYDTRCDLSHKTCWIRQNQRMSDRVSPPTTPSDIIRQRCRKIGCVQFSSDSI